jgi:hypothetical protein
MKNNEKDSAQKFNSKQVSCQPREAQQALQRPKKAQQSSNPTQQSQNQANRQGKVVYMTVQAKQCIYTQLTWDNIQKRNKQGPGWCCLYKNNEETILHLFLNCSFIKEVWRNCSRLLGFQCTWNETTLERAWQVWLNQRDYKVVKALPLLILWGVWLAHNSLIFQENPTVPEVTTTQSLAILSYYLQEKGLAGIHVVQEEEIDKSKPWGFFDGASQNSVCGGGAILYLSDSHFFKMTLGLGKGTNNYAKLMSLKLLLIFAIEKGCRKFMFSVIP